MGFGAASAQAGGSCPCANCDAYAIGLVDTFNPVPVPPTAPCSSPDASGLCCRGNTSVTPMSARRICARAEDCGASVFVEGFVASLSPNEQVHVGFLSSCVECGTGAAHVEDVSFFTSGGVRTPVEVPPGCNQTVTAPLSGKVLTFNQQSCSDGILTVTALSTIGQGAIPVRVARSVAGGAGCGCMACGAEPACIPSTGP